MGVKNQLMKRTAVIDLTVNICSRGFSNLFLSIRALATACGGRLTVQRGLSLHWFLLTCGASPFRGSPAGRPGSFLSRPLRQGSHLDVGEVNKPTQQQQKLIRNPTGPPQELQTQASQSSLSIAPVSVWPKSSTFSRLPLCNKIGSMPFCCFDISTCNREKQNSSSSAYQMCCKRVASSQRLQQVLNKLLKITCASCGWWSVSLLFIVFVSIFFFIGLNTPKYQGLEFSIQTLLFFFVTATVFEPELLASPMSHTFFSQQSRDNNYINQTM